MSDEVLEICKEIIFAAKEKNVPLEINANGFRKGLKKLDGKLRYLYPRDEFWNLVKSIGAKAIINSDAHNPNQIFDQAIIDAYNFSKIHNITVEEELVMD